MDDPTLNRAIKNSGMPVSSLFLATVLHVSIIFALLWSPSTTSTPLMPKDAIELTIERQTTSLAPMIQSVAIPEPPVDSPPIQPALPVPRQPVPQVESAQTPTLENAVPKPEPTPELTSRDFPKVAPVVRKMEQKKLSPKSDPKPDLNKALEPPPGGDITKCVATNSASEPSGCRPTQQKIERLPGADGHKAFAPIYTDREIRRYLPSRPCALQFGNN